MPGFIAYPLCGLLQKGVPYLVLGIFSTTLMTQATIMLGLLPLAINWGEGGDMLQPMAVAVIGGLFFSLFVTLLLLPNLYFIFERKSK